jgi:FtsP/CotA-like multicopper oxidase with cupredoxin domain
LVAAAIPAIAKPSASPARPSKTAAASTGRDEGGGGLAAHEAAEGQRLVAERGETVGEGSGCRRGAPVRRFLLVAAAVDITLNRYLDHDPNGRMYVLEGELERVRAEEARNAAARGPARTAEPGVSLGLQGDAIQPLIIRAHPGECLRVSLRNDLKDEPASFHLHGSSLRVAGTRSPAVATNARALARPGRTVAYEWMVPPDEPEGTHYFHSHGNTREQTSHGLFGAVIVEPRGSEWLDPLSGGPLRSGWAAVIRDPKGADFREFALVYHEIGNESYQLMDALGQFVPLVDPLTSAYRPASRALNYRSEPFMNRLRLQQQRTGRFDESLSYSSYTFGDPATPIMRAYLGDPVKQRVIHGGSEVFHVHHVHGGAIRWRRQPGVERAGFDVGLSKHPPLTPEASERVDAQTIGPAETFDLEDECGSGGCQQSVGDFLVHCHVAHHYFAGMWGIWRVYNTKQDAAWSTDSLPPLAELPDRGGRVATAVSSEGLIGATIDRLGKPFRVDAANLGSWVEAQLPPRGTPRGYDASVLDWRRNGTRSFGEPEAREGWPGYRSPTPGERPKLLFDTKTGKLAYPFLRPHLGKRPPFAPNHGPAPFLDPAQGTDPLAPGGSGPASVCPAGTKVKTFKIHAITLPITINRRANLVDPGGEIYVLKEEEDAVRANNGLRRPLAIRANAGEDCVDVIFASELADSPENHGFAKVNAHIHFVQFDVQASDGVITGFNYEQSVRPFTVAGERVASPSAPGLTALRVGGAGPFQPGAVVGVGMDEAATFEVRRIARISGKTLVFDEPLRFAHKAGEIVSTEFVRYRWYPDVQFGTAYFHDHVNAIASWKHGLFGALVAEPPGSTYHHPRTGEPVRSGPIADVHTDRKVSADVTGSFREMVMFVQDGNSITHIGRSTGSSFNLRAEPLDDRGGPPDRLFANREHADPETPLFEAYVGDPLVVRTLVAGANEVHTWHLDGHWFRAEPWSKTSPPVSTIPIGISERYDLVVPRAGGPQAMAGDYLYYSGRSFKLREGSWGIVRVHDPSGGEGLRRLPGREGAPPAPSGICPRDAPARGFETVAVGAPLPMLDGKEGMIYVLKADAAAVRSGRRAQPLVLHVNVGDCIRVRLANETRGPVSFHADMLAFDPKSSGGVDAGRNPEQTVAPGESKEFTYYAHPEVGETVALVRDFGNVLSNPGQGLYGAIVVGPRGASWRDPADGSDVSARSAWAVDVHPATGPAYRDFTLLLQDEDAGIGTHRMPYSARVAGAVGINYAAEPLADRLADAPDPGSVFSSARHGDPATPVLRAHAGDAVRIHVLAPWSEQAQVFEVEGHRWPFEPGRAGTDLLDAVQVGGLEAITLAVTAGGDERLPGDYLYGDHREPFREAGLWGIFRVAAPCAPSGGERLESLRPCGWSTRTRAASGAGVLLALGAAGLVLGRRRRRSDLRG